MKRHIIHDILWVLGIGLSVLLGACDSKEKWNDLTFYRVEKQEQLNEEPTDAESEKRMLDVKVDMEFVKPTDGLDERAIKLINDQLVEILLKQSSELSADEAVAQYIEDVKAEFHSDEVVNVYYDHLTGRAEYGREGIINYRLVEEVFTGGAHPATQTTILRFSTSTGEYIALEQVFPYPQRQRLQDLLLAKLMQENGARSIEELHQQGILEMSDMFVSNNFALRQDSIEFYYNEYDIAPYAYGACSLCISYEDMPLTERDSSSYRANPYSYRANP